LVCGKVQGLDLDFHRHNTFFIVIKNMNCEVEFFTLTVLNNSHRH